MKASTVRVCLAQTGAGLPAQLRLTLPLVRRRSARLPCHLPFSRCVRNVLCEKGSARLPFHSPFSRCVRNVLCEKGSARLLCHSSDSRCVRNALCVRCGVGCRGGGRGTIAIWFWQRYNACQNKECTFGLCRFFYLLLSG